VHCAIVIVITVFLVVSSLHLFFYCINLLFSKFGYSLSSKCEIKLSMCQYGRCMVSVVSVLTHWLHVGMVCRPSEGSHVSRLSAPAVSQGQAGLHVATAAHWTTSQKLAARLRSWPVLQLSTADALWPSGVSHPSWLYSSSDSDAPYTQM